LFDERMGDLGQTWVDLGGTVCGARADDRGPIGGGDGYGALAQETKDPVSTLDELLEALSQAKSGDVVFIAGDAEIDCTTRVYIEELVLEVPEGVTLASDRGRDGSVGGLIESDTQKTSPLVRVMGPGVRVTGLRIKGPNPKRHIYHHNRSFKEGRGHEYYYKFPVSGGIRSEHDHLEVDNCELGGWAGAAVGLGNGEGHHIHHNFIHHNQYNGLGYGVSHGTAFSLIEYNQFDCNRHSIAGSGAPGSGYEACHNVELGESLSHCFDMHGGRDRKDGTQIAGTWMKVHHNTFRCPKTEVVIRGVPEEKAEVYNNWMYHTPDELSVRSDGSTEIRNNAYGMTDPIFSETEEAKTR
jgi:hypothetical protein